MVAKIKSYQKLGHHKTKPKGISTREFEKVHWPYLPILLVIFAIISFSIQSGSIYAIARGTHSKVLAYSTSMSVNGLLVDSNAARSSNGVGSLSINSKLNAAAQAKANDMASRNYWSHNTPEGNPPWIFVTAQGYAYQKLGENLAAGFSDEQSTINGWMASPPHRENMLDPAFKDVGFGFANNSNYTSAGGGPMTIVVAFYGKPVVAAAPVAQIAPPPAPTATAPAPAPATASKPNNSSASAAESPTPKQNVPTPSKPITTINKDVLTNIDPNKPVPVNTEIDTSGITLGLRTSKAQLAFAKMPISGFATGLATFGLFVAAGFWVSRHLFMLRRVVVHGESFIVKHPLVDVGLIVIAVLSYVLSQTAGFIL